MPYKITNSDYSKILSYYGLEIPKKGIHLKEAAENILSQNKILTLRPLPPHILYCKRCKTEFTSSLKMNAEFLKLVLYVDTKQKKQKIIDKLLI